MTDIFGQDRAGFEHLQSVIQHGIDRKLHTCVQACVMQDGVVLLNQGFGMARSDCQATASTVMLWRSAGKPLTSSGILRLQEAGQLTIDNTVEQLLPAAAGTVFAASQLHELLSHSARLPVLNTGWPHADWPSTIAEVLATPVPASQLPVAYQPQATWFLLGEILRQRSGSTTFGEALNRLVLEPAGLADCWCGLPETQLEAGRDQLPELLERREGRMQSSPLEQLPALTEPSPGGNMRGPVRELARFYEVLRRDGRAIDRQPFLPSSAVAAMTKRWRIGQFDAGLQHQVDTGLGLIINSEHTGPAVPYGFGRFSSPSTFGHGGAQCAMGFCDPHHKLVVAWAANGMCGEPQHQRRNRALNEAIYRDLGLAT